MVVELQAAMSPRTDSLQPLWNTLFWVSLGLVCLIILHAAVRALLIWRRKRIPMFLEVWEARQSSHAALQACRRCCRGSATAHRSVR